jgi:hypothetical protein
MTLTGSTDEEILRGRVWEYETWRLRDHWPVESGYVADYLRGV